VDADGAINGIPIGVDRYLPVGFMVVTGAAGWCIWDLRPQAGYRFPERRS
jgi:hypothetical protein